MKLIELLTREVRSSAESKFIATPELRSDNEIGDDPLEPGQVWTINEGGTDIDDLKKWMP